MRKDGEHADEYSEMFFFLRIRLVILGFFRSDTDFRMYIRIPVAYIPIYVVVVSFLVNRNDLVSEEPSLT